MADPIRHMQLADRIKLQSIQIVSGAINANPDIDSSDIKLYDINFESETGTNIPDNHVRIVFKVMITALGQEDTPIDINATYTIDYRFEVLELESFVASTDEQTGHILLDSMLGGTLMSIVYSTTRGIILTRTQGTIIDGVILPVIDPKTLLGITPNDNQEKESFESETSGPTKE